VGVKYLSPSPLSLALFFSPVHHATSFGPGVLLLPVPLFLHSRVRKLPWIIEFCTEIGWNGGPILLCPPGFFYSSILAVIFVPRVVLCVLEFCFPPPTFVPAQRTLVAGLGVALGRCSALPTPDWEQRRLGTWVAAQQGNLEGARSAWVRAQGSDPAG